MKIGSLVVAAIVLILALTLWRQKGSEALGQGMLAGGSLLLAWGPLLVAAFMLAGLVQVMVPDQAVEKWLGDGSSTRVILIASVAGIFFPIPPRLFFPTLGILLTKGAAAGGIVAFTTAASLCSLQKGLISEVPALGWKYTLTRTALSLWVAPVLGFLVQFVWKKM